MASTLLYSTRMPQLLYTDDKPMANNTFTTQNVKYKYTWRLPTTIRNTLNTNAPREHSYLTVYHVFMPGHQSHLHSQVAEW